MAQHPHREWMSGRSFFAELASPNSWCLRCCSRTMTGAGTRFLYASGPIEDMLPNTFARHIGSLDFLDNATFEQACGPVRGHCRCAQVQMDAWFASDGVTADTHYDTPHNLYMTVFGQKTFLVDPPARALPLHPALHAAYRQVQAR